MKTTKILALAAILMTTVLSANAQKWGNTPEDSINCRKNSNLYRDYYDKKEYLDAYEFWAECIKSCPANNKNLYIRGSVILQAKFNAAKDDAERAAVVEELMHMYDLRIQYFGEAAEVTAKKAFDLERMMGTSAVNRYFPIYAEAMRLGASEMDPAYVERFFDATVRYVTSGNADTTLIIDNYDIAIDAIDKQIEKAGSDSVKLSKVYGVLANIENRFSPFASCDELVKIYNKKFESNPEDINLLKKITSILSKKRCTDTELFFAATEKLHSLEPSPNTAYLMGTMCYKKKKYNDAIRYLNDALKDATEQKDRYSMYILLGYSYSATSSYSASRAAYQSAAQVDGTKGEPYRMIAQLYASSHRSIDDGLGGATAYWAAADMASRAISVDSSPENVEAARKLISSYSSHFPKQSDAFMLDIIDGQSYTIPGWIGVTTTVRTRK
ncbi:MAG: hypothetical protein J6X86_02295 [Bacteroidales bacterium]|nr:hypothetical protein [Bacteroidales bacterium]